MPNMLGPPSQHQDEDRAGGTANWLWRHRRFQMSPTNPKPVPCTI